MKLFRVFAIVAALVGVSAPAHAFTVTDSHGRTVEVTDTSRIVSIGGPVTEILYALGLGPQIVARDTTSVFPEAATQLPDVGYMRALSAEGVLSLSPSVVLAVEGSGPPDVIKLLEAANVSFVNIPDVASADGVAAKIRAVAAAVGEEERGEALASAVEEDFAVVEAAVAKAETHPKAAFVLAMSGGAPLVGGGATSADGALQLAGAQNVFGNISGFKPATPESVLAAAPEVIVTMRTAVHNPEIIANNPIFATTPAGQSKNVVAMDGSYLLGFGPRAAHAMRDLAAALHPELNIPELPQRAWTQPGEQ